MIAFIILATLAVLNYHKIFSITNVDLLINKMDARLVTSVKERIYLRVVTLVPKDQT